ncbi:MAG: tripartite tricarboxylate transporter substrate binding protein [Betaproteobacteria bacterium]|nr:tripartite tricarboxylate transporter substrate binding protein [Betaproteobacteria bacterium]
MKPMRNGRYGEERIAALLRQIKADAPMAEAFWQLSWIPVIALALSWFPVNAYSQTYPSKPVRLIVPFSTGGSIDLLARLVGRKMDEGLGVPVVVDNRTGAGGVIGVKGIADATPDGYTIGIVSPGPTTIATALNPRLPYSLFKDFTFVAALASYVPAVLVSPQVPVKSVKELIAYARANPGKLTYGSAGTGSSVHIMGELFVRAAGIDIVHVPYKGGGPMIQDVLGGHISLGMTSLAAAGPLIKAGKVRALAAMDHERYKTFPDVPAVTEDLPKFEPPIIWYGLLGPRGIPTQITDRLNREAIKALGAAEVQREIVSGAYKVIGGSSRDFQELLKKDAIVMGDVVRAARIKLE